MKFKQLEKQVRVNSRKLRKHINELMQSHAGKYIVFHDNKKFLFYVKDQGLGIEKEKLGDIFENFKQVDSGEASAHHGLGLGLSIVSQLLELMGGHISVKSEIGKGSVFEFYFNQLKNSKN